MEKINVSYTFHRIIVLSSCFQKHFYEDKYEIVDIYMFPEQYYVDDHLKHILAVKNRSQIYNVCNIERISMYAQLE